MEFRIHDREYLLTFAHYYLAVARVARGKGHTIAAREALMSAERWRAALLGNY